MNKEIKIIDLLNMIAEEKKVPKKIKINGIIYKYQGDDYLYKDKYKKYWLFSEGYTDRFMWLDSFLKNKVEIIEEDNNKIENLPKWATTREDKEYTKQEEHILVVSKKLDEIIDKINNME